MQAYLDVTINIFVPACTVLGSSALVRVIKLQQRDQGDADSELSGWWGARPPERGSYSRRAACPSPLLDQGLTFYLLGGSEVFRVMSKRSQVVGVGRSFGNWGPWVFVVWHLSPFG